MLMRLLAERVPLTLLMDILAPPESAELYAFEGGSPDVLDKGTRVPVV